MNVYDKNWRKLRVAAVDTETTGLHPKDHRLTEIGIVYFENGEPVEVFDRLINPERKIDPKASKVSGITNEMVDSLKPFSKMKKRIRRMLKDCDVWVAHNEAFDRSFINAEFERCGWDIPKKPVFDTRIFADFLWPGGPNNLDAVVQRLRLTVNKATLTALDIRRERHRADYDALLCGLALFKLMGRLPAGLGQTLHVQDWMYKTWFNFTKLGDKRYSRILNPTMPPRYGRD